MTMEKVTNWVAASAVVSPAWMPTLTTTSQIAALLLPILGVIWLVVQIYFKVRSHKRDKL